MLILALLLLSLGAKAHSPDISSTMFAEESDGNWILLIRAALTAFEYEIESNFGESSYTTAEEFQQLVIKHVQQNISIKADNSQGNFENPMVRLGHETSITFKVTGMPSDFKSLQITNTSFQNISRNQSALMIIKKGFTKNQFKLDKNNAHTADLAVNNISFELMTPQTMNASFTFGNVVISLFVFGLLFLGYKLLVKPLKKNVIES
jgi:hypothetical protein